MKPSVKIICPTCNEWFLPKTGRNEYCTRSCFKKFYYHRKKAEELANNRYPTFKCPSCREEITLNFDPIKKSDAWLNFVCPHCSVLMINVSEEIVTQDRAIS